MPRKSTSVRRLLIANRGEIACRIIRTCKRLGISTVAVYSDADARAQHVALADERVAIGPAESAASYLNVKAILDAAKRTGADAIHPGYGFLSENADFAAAVDGAKLIFIGPSADTIRRVGNKVEAKKLAHRAGLPLLPGAELPEGIHRQKLRQLLAAVGMPAIVKAAGGGGGRGMRRVYSVTDAEEKIASARSESQKFFGSGEVFIEKLVEPARHIEVQIFGDRAGKVVHLFDRDCSLQRNHQKIIEEAPAPGLDPDLQQSIRDAAVRIGTEAGYENAGTVEFLVDSSGNYYFLEVNARLQVEHPVTEAITGLDLVELQIRIAEGRPLTELVPKLKPLGHAVECRICAEDPARSFAASTGRLESFGVPIAAEPPLDARLDTGFATGDTVTHYYDSLLAKLIVSGPTRESVLAHAAALLGTTGICGISTNVGFLRTLLTAPAVRAIKHHTQLAAELLPSPADDELLRAQAAACYLAWCLLPHPAPASPWAGRSAWRMHGGAVLRREYVSGETTIRAEARLAAGGVQLRANNWSGELRSAAAQEIGFDGVLDGKRVNFRAYCTGGGLFAALNGLAYPLAAWLGEPRVENTGKHVEAIRAPLPGKIIALTVKAGSKVGKGDALLTLESMKMEHIVRAPHDGVVAELKVKVGDIIAANAVLVELDE